MQADVHRNFDSFHRARVAGAADYIEGGMPIVEMILGNIGRPRHCRHFALSSGLMDVRASVRAQRRSLNRAAAYAVKFSATIAAHHAPPRRQLLMAEAN